MSIGQEVTITALKHIVSRGWTTNYRRPGVSVCMKQDILCSLAVHYFEHILLPGCLDVN